MENLVTFEDKSCFGDVFHELDEFRNTKQHCDFVIKVGLEELFAHRLILSASSGYFKGMLKHDTLESQSGFVEMKEVDPESVKFCIDFIYKGIVSVPNEIREDLIHVAKMLQLKKLCDLIANSYINDLQASSFFFIKKLADTYACKNLEEKCREFALENFVGISQMKDFNHLDREYIAFLIESERNNSPAQHKVKALICWTQFDLKERDQHFYSIIKMIDLSQLSFGYRKYLLHKVDLVSDSLDCVRLLCETLLRHVSIAYEDDEIHSFALFDNVSRHIQLLNPISGDCRQMHCLHKDMVTNSFTAVAMHNDIYVFTKNKAVYSLSCSDAFANWKKLPDMLEEHGDRPPAVVVENNIYIVGVSHPCFPANSVERYNPITNVWMKIANKGVSSTKSTPVNFQKCVYSVGGQININSQKRIKDVERLDPISLTWSNIAPMQKARSSPSATEFQANLYVLGGHTGYDRLRSVECYDHVNNLWTMLVPMLTARSSFKTFDTNHEIYVVGDHDQNPSTLEKFDPNKNEWEYVELPDSLSDIKILWSVGLSLL